MSITGQFDSKLGDFHLDVAFSIPDRGVTGIFGPSGCGKTSLLRAIAGLDRHANGQLKVAATTWQDEHTFLAPHRRPVAFVFQQANLFEHLSVQANLEYGWKRLKPRQRRIPLPRIIELLDLGSLANRRPARLSGGEQQRVAIGRALAASPELLLMDEPLASLDLARRNEILPYLESLHTEFDLPVIYVSHDRQEMGRLADYLLLIQDGRISASGLCQDLFTQLEQPLAREDDSASFLQAKVISIDPEYHLSYVRCGDIDLIVTGDALPVGHEARLSIAARDVSITLSRPVDSSILNIMSAAIESITEPLQGRVTLRLRCGELVLLSHVTHRSATLLGLHEGQEVFAQVKSIALSNTGSST